MLIRVCLAAAVCAAAAPLFAQAPPGADVVPTNAFAFVSVKVADLWDAPVLKPAREVLARGEKPLAHEVVPFLGVAPEEIERVTLFWPGVSFGAGAEVPFVVLTTRKPYNEVRLLRALKARIGFGPFPPGAAVDVAPPAAKSATVKEDKKCGEEVADDPPADAPTPGAELYFLHDRPFAAAYLLDNRTVLFVPGLRGEFGNPGLIALVGQLLKRKADGPLAEALKLAGKHTIVAAVRADLVGQATSMIQAQLPAELVPFRALLKTKTLVVTADVADKADVTVRLAFPDAADARRADPVLRTLLQMGAEQLTGLRKEAEKDETTAAVVIPLLEVAAKALDAADVKTDGATVAARAAVEFGPAVAKAMAAAPAVIGDSSERMKTQNNLKMIGIAIHNYHDTYNQFPADVTDANGKPILSWRVQLLPYLEQAPLFQRLDLKKPWDDPANKAVLEQMPDVYKVKGREAAAGQTYFQMFTAPKADAAGSPFLVPGRKMNFATVADGLSNTFMVVEAADSVNWMKPGDLPFDPKNLPKLGSPRGRFQALFGDGSVREFRRPKLSDDVLRALITVNGGEVITLPD